MRRSAVIVIVLVVGLGIGIWFFTKDSAPTPSSNSNDTSAITNNATTPQRVYADAETGWSIQHPADWKVTEDTSGEGKNTIRNITFTGTGEAVTITIVNTSFEGIIRESLSIKEETDISFNDVPAKRLEAGSARDGSPQTVVLVKRDTTLISLNGHGQAFENMLSTFRWPLPEAPPVQE